MIYKHLNPDIPTLAKYSRRLLSTDLWKEKLDVNLYKKTENYWRQRFSHKRLFNPDRINDKFYLLSMFPYPSGNLHMGHVRVYTISDALALFYRMNGKNVFHPMGWDAFGLPAENAAFERQVFPEDWTKQNIAEMKKQLKKLSFSFDWDYEISTCDPKYYRWTQYIFLKMYEAGLVYRKKALVNWDPVDETVLANEQVDENGCSWRSGSKVQKLVLKQWFIRTTKFAKKMREELNNPELKNWEDIIDVQKNWIGECNGYSFDLKILSSDDDSSVNVWVKDPLFMLKAEFIVIKPNSLLDILSKKDCGNERKIEFTAVNPFTKRVLPIYVSSKIKYPFQRDIYVGVPSIVESDKEFALSVDHRLDNMESVEMKAEELCEYAQKLGIGGYPVNSRLNDWLISRQRYWGTPIPLIHCEKCGVQPVPYNELPVILPPIPKDHFINNKLNKVLKQSDWRKTSCPKCGENALRETDTMDTFVDSSWYYLRYGDCNNEERPFGDIAKQLMPIDLYIGGKEHAVLHLYYARFMCHFLQSIGLIEQREPFSSLMCQGKVKNKTYKNAEGRYLKPNEVISKGKKVLLKSTNEEITYSWEKMSKSKYNGIEPGTVIDQYGVDTTRLFVIYNYSPKVDMNWDPKIFTDILQWQYRLWLTIKDFLRVRSNPLKGPQPVINMQEEEAALKRARNSFLGKISYHYHETRNLCIVAYHLENLTAILRKPAREVRKYSKEYERCLATCLIMLAPLAPHFACTLWFGFTAAPARISGIEEIAWNESAVDQNWPKVDPDYSIPLNCRINEKSIFEICRIENRILRTLTVEEAYNYALGHEKFQLFMKSKKLTGANLEKHEGYNVLLDVSATDGSS